MSRDTRKHMARSGMIRCGTSGFSYPDWRGTFYPDGLSPKRLLAHYGTRLTAVENTGTFYGWPKVAVLQTWLEAVPPDFRFCVKAPRNISHSKRLWDIGDEVRSFMGIVDHLGDRLGALSVQLPANFHIDLERLDHAQAVLPSSVPVVFEFRCSTWFDPRVTERLQRHGHALCFVDEDEPVPGSPNELSSDLDWGYVRLRRDSYTETDIKLMAERLQRAGWSRGFVFLRHDETGDHALHAERLQRILTLGSTAR